MSDQDLSKEIETLKKRIKELEERPVLSPVWVPVMDEKLKKLEEKVKHLEDHLGHRRGG